MPNWGWLVIGVMLLGAEMFVVDAQFYLVFIGVAAAVVGIIGWLGLTMPVAGQWLLFAVLSLGAMTTFRKRLYGMLRRSPDAAVTGSSVGERIELPQLLPPGQQCRVDHRGSSWSARNVDDHALSGEVQVVAIDGLTLLVKGLQ